MGGLTERETLIPRHKLVSKSLGDALDEAYHRVNRGSFLPAT